MVKTLLNLPGCVQKRPEEIAHQIRIFLNLITKRSGGLGGQKWPHVLTVLDHRTHIAQAQ
jgi:hypothetical protein